MSEYTHKSHNVAVLMYHLVFPAKYRRDEQVDAVLKEICLGIGKRYQVKFLEIGTDKDHVHFLVQSVPSYSVTHLVTLIKSITARKIFKWCPKLRRSSGVESFGLKVISQVQLASMGMSRGLASMYKIKVKHIRNYTQIISLRCSERKYPLLAAGFY